MQLIRQRDGCAANKPGNLLFCERRTGKVPPQVATLRVKRLEELCGRLHREFCERFVGRRLEVLFEGACRGGMMSGFTGNYIKVKAPLNRSLINRIVPVTLDRIGDDCEAIAHM